MIVKVIKLENTRRPDIDENIYSGWSVVKDFGDTMEVEVTKRPEVLAKENESIRASSQLIAAERILDERLPTDRISEFLDLFDYPIHGRKYTLNWVLRDRDSNKLFKVIEDQLIWDSAFIINDIPDKVKVFDF